MRWEQVQNSTKCFSAVEIRWEQVQNSTKWFSAMQWHESTWPQRERERITSLRGKEGKTEMSKISATIKSEEWKGKRIAKSMMSVWTTGKTERRQPCQKYQHCIDWEMPAKTSTAPRISKKSWVLFLQNCALCGQPCVPISWQHTLDSKLKAKVRNSISMRWLNGNKG